MWPDKAQYRPGDAVTLHVERGGAASVQICELAHVVAVVPVTEGHAVWTAPQAELDYARGFRAEAVDAHGTPLESTGFDVASHWSVAPRYGFLTDFKPSDTAECVEGLNRLHLNVVQYYDWMYTHYQYFAETEEFVDPLGRPTSHRVVRDRIDACHAHGIACLAYGSMYGGEKPIATAHPEWLLYDGNGQPFHLIDLFYIQNVERDCPWRDHIMAEYAKALERLDFDGIHIDQYGFPKRGMYRPMPGVERVVDMTAAMPDFVADACQRLNRIKPDGGSLFNNVNSWPVERVAPLIGDAATYIEVWSPHDTYRDLHDLVTHAKAAGPHKQVILSAYLKPFHRDYQRPVGALPALKLATAAIYASGGFHLLLGEGNGVLADAYYPNFGRLSDADLAQVQRYYDFVTAYGELLHDKQLRDVTCTWDETRVTAPVAASPMAEAGQVWMLQREKPGRRVIHLVNLCGLEHNRWNAPQAEPTPLKQVELLVHVWTPIRGVWCASPDDGGAPRKLDTEPTSYDGKPFVRVRLPQLHCWTVLWVEE